MILINADMLLLHEQGRLSFLFLDDMVIEVRLTQTSTYKTLEYHLAK